MDIEKKSHYPRLPQICSHLGLDVLLSDKSEKYLSQYELSTGTLETSKVIHIVVDPLLGKENELFRMGFKNVKTLEKGLALPRLGKETISLFLESAIRQRISVISVSKFR